MRLFWASLGAACVLGAAGCNCGVGSTADGGGTPDGAGTDGGNTPDGGSSDGGSSPDGGTVDGGTTDSGSIDDAGAPNGGSDAGVEPSLPGVEAAIVDGVGSISLLHLDGGMSPLLTPTVVSGYPVGLRWNPRGTRLAWADGELAYFGELDGSVQAAAIDQGGRYRAGNTTRVEWSPDGTRLAMDGIDNDTDGLALFLVALDGGEPDFIVPATRWAWTPDSQGLLYSDFVYPTGFFTSRFELSSRDAGLLLDAELLDTSPRGLTAYARSLALDDGGTEELVFVVWPDGRTSPLLPQGSVTVSERWPTTVALSPYADEAALWTTDPATGKSRLVRASPTTGWEILLETFGQPPSPPCFRFLPGGDWLSFIDPLAPDAVVLTTRDGGVATLSFQASDRASGRECLDWRVTP